MAILNTRTLAADAKVHTPRPDGRPRREVRLDRGQGVSEWVSALIHGWTTEPPYRVCVIVPDSATSNLYVWLSTEDVRAETGDTDEPGQT